MTLGSVLLLVLISIAIGFLIGALVYGLRSKPSDTGPAQAGEAGLPEEGVRLRRDPQTQSLVVELEGKTYQQAGELTPRRRGELAQLAREWQLWLGMPLARLAALSASSGEAGEPIDTQASQPIEGKPPSEARGATRPATGPEIYTAPAGATQIRAPGRSSTTQGTPSSQSIAAQIDEILQTRLQNTPLAARGIQLIELPGQGLVVKVGQAEYTDLTQVPDEEVRAAIAVAVAEWERRNAPQAGTR